MCAAFLPCVPAGQKGAQGLITDGCEPPCGCWELNSGPLEEQSVLSTPCWQPVNNFTAWAVSAQSRVLQSTNGAALCCHANVVAWETYLFFPNISIFPNSEPTGLSTIFRFSVPF